MKNMDYETTRQLKTDLNDALRNLKQRHSSFSTARMELDYTWNVAMEELTWVLRHATVFFNGIYHVVYNMAGFAYIWEMQFSIEDTLDLRPHSGDKLNFHGAYDIVTSIFGTVYHDLLGNTDKLKVRAYWNEMGTDDAIHEW